MNYDKLIADAATKLNSLVNEIIDALDKEGTPVNPGTIISDITAKAFPEKDGVTQVDPTEPEGGSDDHFGEGQAEGLTDLLAGLKDSPHDDRW